AEDVREIMKKKFGWSFPILDYADVNGGDATELYKVLKEAKGISTSSTGLKKIDWNFEKILVDKVRSYYLLTPLKSLCNVHVIHHILTLRSLTLSTHNL
ncbi:hypothetical protein B484DRAFT_339435, partial [Ochromonadaceae sp. CCMP2298]